MKVVKYVKGSGSTADSATVEDAEGLDFVTTAFSTTRALVGVPKVAQSVALVATGMAIQSKRSSDTFNFLAV